MQMNDVELGRNELPDSDSTNLSHAPWHVFPESESGSRGLDFLGWIGGEIFFRVEGYS